MIQRSHCGQQKDINDSSNTEQINNNLPVITCVNSSFSLDSAADLLFRNRHQNEDISSHAPLGVTLANGSTTKGTIDQNEEGVWPTKVSDEHGNLAPLTRSTASKEAGGGGYSAVMCPKGTFLSVIPEEEQQKLVDTVKGGKDVLIPQLSSQIGAAPVLNATDTNILRGHLALGNALKQGTISKETAENCPIDSLFASNHSARRLGSRAIESANWSVDNPPLAVFDSKGWTKQANESRSDTRDLVQACRSQIRAKLIARTMSRKVSARRSRCKSSRLFHSPVHCLELVYKGGDDTLFQDIAVLKQRQGLSATQLQDLYDSFGSSTEFIQWTRKTIAIDDQQDDDVPEPEDSSTHSDRSTEENELVANDDPVGVTWGDCDDVVLYDPNDDDYASTCQSEDEVEDVDTNDDHDSSSDIQNEDIEEAFAMRLNSKLRGDNFVAATVNARVRKVFTRAMTKRFRQHSRNGVIFDPQSKHLTEIDRHNLCHLPHSKDCECCNNGRIKLATTTTGLNAGPNTINHAACFITADFVGPLSTASNGHDRYLCIAWHRSNKSPLLYCQSIKSRAGGTVPVMLHAARTAWHILDQPYALASDNEALLCDAYLQRYLALSILPRNQINVHARNSKVQEIENDTSTKLSGSGGHSLPNDMFSEYTNIFNNQPNFQNSIYWNPDNVLDFKTNEYDIVHARSGTIAETIEVQAKAAGNSSQLHPKPVGKPPSNSVWNPKTGQYDKLPTNDDEADLARKQRAKNRPRGAPPKGALWSSEVAGYVYPADLTNHHFTKAEGLGVKLDGVPYRSNTCGRSERAVRTSIELLRSMLSSSGFKHNWWHIVVNNICPLQLTYENTILEEGEKPIIPGRNVSQIVPLGTLGVARLPSAKRPKSTAMAPKLIPCCFAGVNLRSSTGVKILYSASDGGNTVLRSLHIKSADVQFYPGQFAFTKTVSNLRDAAMMSKSICMTMQLDDTQSGPKNGPKSTIFQCEDCGKWRKISSHNCDKHRKKIDKAIENKSQIPKWNCKIAQDKPDCSVKEDESLFGFLGNCARRKMSEEEGVTNIPELLESPLDEPTAHEGEIEDETLVHAHDRARAAAAKLVNRNLDTNIEIPDKFKDLSGLLDGAWRDFKESICEAIHATSVFDVGKARKVFQTLGQDQQAFGFMINPDLPADTALAFARTQSDTRSEGHNGKIPCTVTARNVVVSNGKAFNATNPELPKWIEALDKELRSLVENGILVPVPINSIPNGAQLIPSLVVCTRKDDGRYKNRLVACGNYVEDSHYTAEDLFAPTVTRSDTLSLMLWSLSDKNLKWSSVDIKTAFLQSDPTIATQASKKEREGIYLRPPAIAVKHGKNETLPSIGQAWKILKSIYGLRCAPKAWARTLQQYFKEQGYVTLETDDAVLINCIDPKTHARVVLAAYVDDLNIFGSALDVDAAMKAVLERFEVSGDPVTIRESTRNNPIMYLAQQFWCERDGEKEFLCMSMETYCENLVIKHDLEDIRPSTKLSPLHFENQRLVGGEVLDKANAKKYRGIVAAAQYLASAHRPDLLVPVNKLASQQAAPRTGAFDAAKKLISYVVGTKSHEFRVPVGESWADAKLVGFVDASYECDETARSGFILGLKTASGTFLPLSWRCIKQKTICLSTCEAEITALSCCVRELLSVYRYMSEWLPSDQVPKGIQILADNQSANLISSSAANVRKVRHLTLAQLFVRQVVKDPDKYNSPPMEISYIKTTLNISDMCTKVLAPDVVANHLRKIHLQEPSDSEVSVTH